MFILLKEWIELPSSEEESQGRVFSLNLGSLVWNKVQKQSQTFSARPRSAGSASSFLFSLYPTGEY